MPIHPTPNGHRILALRQDGSVPTDSAKHRFIQGSLGRNVMDRTGLRCGRLVILGYSHSAKGMTYWRCACDCGNEKIAGEWIFRHSRDWSCGCYSGRTKHGMRNTRIYQIWKGIRLRCLNKRDPGFPLYGGRGISICERWESFSNFYQDMGDPPSDHHSIDRIDNSRGYGPSNCRWATPKEQARDRRSNVLVTINGVTKCVLDWSRDPICSVSAKAIYERIRKGWNPVRAVTEAIDPRVLRKAESSK